ncbi:MAG: ribosomal L7Ae/L30e/S12e/Gadd45 family protein [Candidatus Aenigmatarchaeota archaeon]
MAKKGRDGVIGTREIIKGIKNGNIKRIIVANNCPDFLIEKLSNFKDVKIERFDGDQSQLGTKVGKPFPVAMVGYEE